MFTGIISHLGKVKTKSENTLSIVCSKDVTTKLSIGASIAVDGICLTVVKMNKDSFAIDFMPETGRKTNIQYFKTSDLVNLELPATPDTFLAGHVVQGHIDGMVKLINIKVEGNSRIFKFSIPSPISQYIVEKGSVALNGISLTVIKAGKNYFTVGIIPYTWEGTNLHVLEKGDYVNLETDILAKYLERLVKI